jgi:hypothetical protein
MKRLAALAFLLVAATMLAVPTRGTAQPVCPPGYVWAGGACRPAGPPPPPPRYAPPPPPGYDPNIKQVARRAITVHSCPGEGCPPVTSLTYGTPVRIVGWEGPFVRVHVPGTPIDGWVKRRQLTP